MNIQLLRNKNLYKLTAILIKYLPSGLALWQILMTGLNYIGITVPVMGFLGGSSLIVLVLLYLLSYLFQYCYLYRMPLAYNLTMNTLVLLRNYKVLTMPILDLYQLFMIVTGIFILIFVYFMYKNRKNPKVGGIKSFCEKYCDY
jgi:predicted ferric reductase